MKKTKYLLLSTPCWLIVATILIYEGANILGYFSFLGTDYFIFSVFGFAWISLLAIVVTIGIAILKHSSFGYLGAIAMGATIIVLPSFGYYYAYEIFRGEILGILWIAGVLLRIAMQFYWYVYRTEKKNVASVKARHEALFVVAGIVLIFIFKNLAFFGQFLT